MVNQCSKVGQFLRSKLGGRSMRGYALIIRWMNWRFGDLEIWSLIDYGSNSSAFIQNLIGAQGELVDLLPYESFKTTNTGVYVL